MLKRLEHGQACCIGELSSRDKFNLCTFLERFCSKFQHNQLNNELCIAYFGEHCSVLLHKHFKMTPKSEKFNIFVFLQLVYFLNSFGDRMLANVHQRLNV